jgi:midasin
MTSMRVDDPNDKLTSDSARPYVADADDADDADDDGAGAAAAPDPVSLTDEEAADVRLELERRLEELLSSPGDTAAATDAWLKFDSATRGHSQELCEQLRLILEASLASKLAGDYRTGKRLNIRKIIPYIASEFRKDKIWLRRTKPNKREYQVMVAIDDSWSMAR